MAVIMREATRSVSIQPTGQFQARVLVVDDERGPRQALRMLLNDRYEVLLAPDVPSGLQVLQTEPVDVIITDLRMPGYSGIDLLRTVKREQPDVEVIILTGYGQLETAVKAVEFGAFSYMEKPFDNDLMLRQVSGALEKRRQTNERRRLEHLALEANRFELLGRVVSGMIHDLGTPLAVISAQVEMMMLRPGEHGDRLEVVYGQVHHCSDIIRATMHFLSSQTPDHSSMSLNDVVERCLEVAKPLFRRQDISVELELCEMLPLCNGSFPLVRQAVLNLITNACQAMEHQVAPKHIRLRTWSENGNNWLCVSDTGPGIPAKDQVKVFDTFYTTKGDSGTGLGLAVVKNVMRRHHGDVYLETNDDGGAAFSLQFPLEASKV